MFASSKDVHAAVARGEVMEVEKIVQRGCEHGHVESVMLQQRETTLGLTPLHVACESMQLSMLKVRGGSEAHSHACRATHACMASLSMS